MQFFSRYSYIWKFEREEEIKYDLFVRPSQLAPLRLVTFITIFGMSIFLVIDAFKDVDYSVVLVTRTCVLANIFFFLAFIFYSQVVKMDPFYYSERPHLFSIFFISISWAWCSKAEGAKFFYCSIFCSPQRR